MEITDLLTFAVKNHASDIHLSAGNPPIFRINGEMTPMNKTTHLTHDQVKQMVYSVMTEQQRTEYEKEMELDFAISYGANMRFRVNAFNGISGSAAVMRNIPTETRSLNRLGAPEILKKLAQLHKGLILVTGPTGSGKSTTMAAMVDYINNHYAKHIITIEDPVEFVHKSKTSLINQREVGHSTKSFARALKSALREDPDVILVGEMRDIETIQLAITAAETGHLVMGTLHTSSAPKTIDRIIDVFPAGSKEMIRAMLSVSLEAVITQTLLKRADGTGRVAAYEILLGTPAARNMIREGKVPQLYSVMQTGVKMGMKTMKDYVMELRDKGIVTDDEAKKVILNTSDDTSNVDSMEQPDSKKPAGTGPVMPKTPSISSRINSGF